MAKQKEQQSRLSGAAYNNAPAIIALCYFLLAVLWIMFSDRTIGSVAINTAEITWLQTLKGLGFVAVSTLVLYLVVKRPMGKLSSITRQLTETQQKAAREEMLYRSLFENMVSGLAYCQLLYKDGQPDDFVYLDANAAAERLLGVKHLAGKKMSQVIPGLLESNPELGEKYNQAAESGVPDRFELYVPQMEIWLSISVYSPEEGYFIIIFDNITEWKNTEARIAHLASFPELDSNPVVEMSEQGQVLYANQAAAGLLPNGGDNHPYLADWPEVMAELKNNGSDNLTREIRVADRYFMQHILSYPESHSFHIYGHDITERRLAEENISQLNRILRALRNVNQLITREHDRQRLLDGACLNMVETRGFEKCWLATLDDEGHISATAEAGWGTEFEHKEKYLKRGELPACAKQVMSSGSLIINEQNQAELCDVCPMCPKDQHNQKFVAAMRYAGRVRGIITASSPAGIPISEEEVDLFQELADDIAFTLNNLELEQKRRQTESNLATSEHMYRMLVSNVPSGVSIVSDGKIVFANSQVERLTGYSQAEMQAMDPFSIIHSDDRGRVRKYAVMRSSGQPMPDSYDLRIYHKDGSIRWLGRRVVAINWQGKEASLILDTDITERKHAENALAEEIARRRQLFAQTPVGIVLLDPQTLKFMEFNTVAHLQLGYSREEFGELDLTQIEASESPEETKQHIEAVLCNGKEEFYTVQRTKEGELRNIYVIAQTANAGGNIVYQCIWQDVTERKKAEEALREGEEQLRRLYASMTEGVCIHDMIYNEAGQPVDYIIRDVNPAYEKILGLERSEVIGKKGSEVYRADEPPYLGAYARVASSGEPSFFETYFAPMDKHFSISVFSPEKDRFATVFTDITERRRAEQLLKKNEERYRHIFEGLNEAVIFVEPNTGVIVDVNHNAEMLLGRKRKEIIGTHQAEMHPPARHQASIEQFKQNVSKKRVFDVENEVITKDGQIVPVTISASMVNLNGRELMMGVFHDISARKRAETSIKLSEQRYRYISDIIIDFAYSCTRTPGGDFNIDWLVGAVERITGYSINEVKERGCWRFLVHPEDLEIFDQNIIELGPGEFSSFELRIIHHSGEVRWLQCRARVVDEESPVKLHRLFGGVEDVTERKKADEALRVSERTIQDSYIKLQRTLEGTIEAITRMSEMRDPYTAGHQKRVSQLACAIAQEMKLPKEDIDGLRIAALVHDIGKLQVPSEILTKPGRLSPIEFQLIESHATNGFQILESVEFPWPVAEIVSQHHERIDGSGYPLGLTGEQIMIEARILAVADAVEAMASHRPYRPARGIKQALEEVTKGSGTLFDAEVVKACVNVFNNGYQITEVETPTERRS
jgi:PAS domain S-box-containing protein/putative nucleotidyltransferase with HDIG domain